MSVIGILPNDALASLQVEQKTRYIQEQEDRTYPYTSAKSITQQINNSFLNGMIFRHMINTIFVENL